jgi:hypothetical protein
LGDIGDDLDNIDRLGARGRGEEDDPADHHLHGYP